MTFAIDFVNILFMEKKKTRETLYKPNPDREPLLHKRSRASWV